MELRSCILFVCASLAPIQAFSGAPQHFSAVRKDEVRAVSNETENADSESVPFPKEDAKHSVGVRATVITNSRNGEAEVEIGRKIGEDLTMIMRYGKSFFEYIGYCGDQTLTQRSSLILSYQPFRRFYLSGGITYRDARVRYRAENSTPLDPRDNQFHECETYMVDYSHRVEMPFAFGWILRSDNFHVGVEAFSVSLPLKETNGHSTFIPNTDTYEGRDREEAYSRSVHLKARPDWRFATVYFAFEL